MVWPSAAGRAHCNGSDNANNIRHTVLNNQLAHDDAGEGYNRADRNINAAGKDNNVNAQCKHSDNRYLLENVNEVCYRTERRLCDSQANAKHDQHDQSGRIGKVDFLQLLFHLFALTSYLFSRRSRNRLPALP